VKCRQADECASPRCRRSFRL